MPRARSTVLLLALLAVAPAAGALAQSTRAVSRSGDWTLYSHDGGPSRICFITTQPRAQEPKGTGRDPVHLFISGWPREGVKSEISIKLGYPARKGADVTVTVGNANFKMFTAGDRAFVADPTEELKLLEALKKGSTMVVQSTSERGVQTKDTYSLQGLTQALQSMISGCT